MAKRRKLKKAVAYVCGELYADCMAISLLKEEANKETLTEIEGDITHLLDDMMAGIGTPEPGLPARKYFAALRGNMEKRVAEIAERLTALV